VAAFLRDPEARRTAGAAASTLARDHFDRDLLFQDFERVLTEAVASAGPARRLEAST